MRTPSAAVVTRRQALQQLGLTAVGLGVAACAPAATPTRPTGPASAAAPSPAPAARQVANVRIALPVKTLSFAPVFIADAMKYFEQEAIDADLQVMQGNAITIAALLGGDVQFHVWGANDVFTAVERDLSLLTVAGLTRQFTTSIAGRAEFLQERGITAQSSLKAKLDALKDARVGVNSIAAIQTQALKYMLGKQGLDPSSDVDFVAVGAGGPMNAALRRGHVDAVIAATPFPEMAEREGLATIFLRLADEVPVFKNWAAGTLAGQRQWIESNADVTQRVCRAIGRACNLLTSDWQASSAALKSAFSETEPELVELAIGSMKGAFSADARMTEEQWSNAAEVFRFAGVMDTVPPLAEGTFWTNRYLAGGPRA